MPVFFWKVCPPVLRLRRDKMVAIGKNSVIMRGALGG